MSQATRAQIRNSIAEFPVFTRQSGESSFEVRVEDETCGCPRS